MFAHIQGRVCRTQQLGELRLTEAVYPPGSRLPEHEHEYGCFGFVLEGDLCEQFGSRTLVYERSSVFFRPPAVAHRDDIGQGARCFHVEISPRWLDHVNQFGQGLKQATVLHDPPLRWLATHLYQEWLQLDAAGPLAIEGLTYEMAAYLCRSLSPDRAENGNPPLWLRKAKEIIETHYRDRLSLRDVANAVSLHPVHVARQFRRYVGMSVGNLICTRRIEFARQNLSLTDKPLVDIALESGFAQQAHFTTAFRRITGVTPLEYRKNAQLRGR
jgi:AraC family transcriptional regulator